MVDQRHHQGRENIPRRAIHVQNGCKINCVELCIKGIEIKFFNEIQRSNDQVSLDKGSLIMYKK